MRELLSDGVYLRYWLAVVTSFLGDGFARVTVIFVAAGLTGSPALFLSIVVMAQLLPTGVLGAFVGPFVDRVPPRVLLVGADLFRVGVVIGLVFAMNSPVLLVVLILLEGVGKAVFETARMAAIPAVVGGHSIPSAVALFQSTVYVLNLLGPLVGGVLIGLVGVKLVFVLDAVTFVVSAVLLGSIAVLGRRASPARQAGVGYLRSIIVGARGVIAEPSLRLLLWALVPMMLAVGLFTTNVNAQLLDAFRLSAFDYGLGQAMLGAGAVVGALLGPGLMQRWSAEGILPVSCVTFALSMAALWPIDAAWPASGLGAVLAWSVATGLGMNLIQVPVANLLLRDLPEEVRGRGIALVNALMINLMVIGVLLGGLVGEWIGVAASIVVTGVVLLAASVPLMPTTRVVLQRRSEGAW